MSIKNKLKKIIKEIDKYSPYPLFFPYAMTKSEKELFDKKVKKSKIYLEFGMGGSTFRTLLHSKATVYSIDSSLSWISFMREYSLIRRLENNRLKLIHVNIGPTKEWGNPVGNTSKDLFPNYSAAIFKSIKKETIDTILVDGRFRVACTLKSISECYKNDKLEILIHDFWIRPDYHIVLKYLDEIDRADTLGVFKIKDKIDLNAIANDYDIYKYDPS